MNDVAKEVRAPFDITDAIVAYRDSGEDDEPDPITIPAGRRLWAQVKNQQVRRLRGRLVPVVRFTMGIDPTWYWVPREVFDRVARPV